MDLFDIAARLEAGEKFTLTYKFPVRTEGGALTYEPCDGKLLDVSEQKGRLYVERGNEVVWVAIEEAIELTPCR